MPLMPLYSHYFPVRTSPAFDPNKFPLLKFFMIQLAPYMNFQMMDSEAHFSSSAILTILAVLLATYLLLIHLSTQKWHPTEPPIVPCPFPLPLPYVGHLLGMALQGGHYIKQLGIAHPRLPIFTLVVPFSRLYIVTSPTLATAVQRKPARELSWNKLLPEITGRVLGLDHATKKIVRKGLELGSIGNNGGGRGVKETGMLVDMHDMLVSYLGPGKELDALTLDAVKELVHELEEYCETTLASKRDGAKGKEEDLLQWVRHIVGVSAARVLYGDRNPLAMQRKVQDTRGLGDDDDDDDNDNDDLEAGFWNFDHGLGRLLMGIWPSMTAKKAYRGRERLVAGFREYLERKYYEPLPADAVPSSVSDEDEARTQGRGASQLILNRLRVCTQHGFSTDGTARSETSFLFAAIVNTATVTFWTVLRICADQELLRDVREELQMCGAFDEIDDVVGGGSEDTEGNRKKRRKYQLSMSRLTKNNYTACPLLYAVYREVLRLGSNNMGARLVLGSDTNENSDMSSKGHVRLETSQDGEYLLRKGGVVQIAGGVMHANKTTWGDDAHIFNPRRHLRKNLLRYQHKNNELSNDSAITNISEKLSTGGRGGEAIHPGALRPFGGGSSRCPGQAFATAEILNLVACILLRFDIEGADVESDGKGQKKRAGLQVPELNDYIMPVHILEPVAGDPVRVRIRLREVGGRVEVVP